MTATSTVTVFIPDIEGEFYDLDVEFGGETYVENDSFDHAFGTEEKPDYLIIDGDITWDKSKHTEWENAAIAAYLDNKENWDKVEGELIKEVMEDYDCND